MSIVSPEFARMREDKHVRQFGKLESFLVNQRALVIEKRVRPLEVSNETRVGN